MAKNFSLPRGATDILPQDIPLWIHIEKTARQILNLYGYQEIRTPLFEETELFARSMGQTSDVVQKQMLTLQPSKSPENEKAESAHYALRPEGTASVVRSYIENHLDKKESLSKLFYIGPMFRGERPQKGRLRQFHQIGVEAIGPGTASPYLDAEVIACSMYLLKSLGVSGAQLKINTLGTYANKEEFKNILRGKLSGKLSELCWDCQNRFERNVLRILDCKVPACKMAVQKLKLNYEWLDAESKTYFDTMKKILSGLNVIYKEDPYLVRGLDYYTHTVFEISDSSLGSQDAVGAGGRYNNLITELGGPQVDAIGFALGIERIILAQQGKIQVPQPSLDIFVIAMEEKFIKNAFALVQQIRHNGLSADASYEGSSMKSQMRQANKRNARYVMILGEDEIKANEVALKNMQNGDQEKVSLNLINETIQKLK